jgi:vacuolar protein sorting-associated protein 13A/C
MFEGWIGQWLTSLLGEYFEETCFAPNKVKASVAYGHIVLEDLLLKPSALDFLELPIIVSRGFVGQLELKIGGGNWTKLGSQPVEIWMDRVFVVISPNSGIDPVQVKNQDHRAKMLSVSPPFILFGHMTFDGDRLHKLRCLPPLKINFPAINQYRGLHLVWAQKFSRT